MALTAKELMTTQVHTVRTDTPLMEIAQLLAEHHISGVPVVDSEGHVLGMVTEADLIDEHKREARIPRFALFGVFPLPDDVVSQAAREGKLLQAGQLMSRSVVTATEETTAHELADLMVKHRINRIPILRDGRLAGIVGRGDLLRAIAQGQTL
jgi:CBS domain-containing protein